MPKKIKTKPHHIKLIRWYDAGFPPIDLSEQFNSIKELIRYAKELEKQLQFYADKNQNQGG
jgi:hypothetical protein